jgi:hypothetical protein
VANKEVDFVAASQEGLTYIQVSASILDDNTLKRELAPLKAIQDNHPKLLLSLDEIGAGSNHDGIQQKNLLQWLITK